MQRRKNTPKKPERIDPATKILLGQIARGAAVFAVVGLVVAGIYHVTRAQVVTIATISVEGGITISHDEVRSTVDSVLQGTYLGIVPKRFAYFYPEAEVYTAVAQTPRIKDVHIKRVSSTEIAVSFAEYIPDALVCTEGEADETCYFMDSAGFAFAVAPNLTGESMIRYYLPDGTVTLGTPIFAEEDYTAMTSFMNRLQSLGWFVERVEVTTSRDVFYVLTRGGELKTTLLQNEADTYENLITILRAEEFADLQTAPFQYIDLRFGTRVFVNEEVPVLDTATTTSTTSEEVILE